MGVLRMASVPNKTFFRLGAPPYLLGDVAVLVGIESPFWPNLLDPALISTGDIGPALRLWYQSSVSPPLAVSGEAAFFGREINISIPEPGMPANPVVILSISGDNAFQSQITITPSGGAPVTLDCNDGNTSINFNDPGPPYHWQNVYEFVFEVPTMAGATSIDLQFETEVVNYAMAGGTPEDNPAGFIYSLEIPNVPAGATITEIQPPLIPIIPLNLGTASTFGLLGDTLSITNPVTVIGDVGSGSGGQTATPIFTGTNHLNDVVYNTANADLGNAIIDANSRTNTVVLGPGAVDVGGQTLTPGVYFFPAAGSITGTVTLDGPGLYIFKITGTFNTAANAVVALTNGASPCNIFWVVTGATTLGANTVFQGTVMSNTAITVGANSVIAGRVLSQSTDTVSTSQITVPICPP